MNTQPIRPKDVLDFWFGAGEDKWYAKDDDLDAEIRARFADANAAARDGAYDEWAASPQGAMALVILLDQFSRNIHRDSAEAFSADDKARVIADAAIKAGFDMELPASARQWFYLPFMHSEALADQDRCLELAPRTGLPATHEFAVLHRDIIVRFGRFPHRNRLLGRETTPEEQAFLDDGGFSG